MLMRKCIDHIKPNIVTGGLVCYARIAQTNNQKFCMGSKIIEIITARKPLCKS